MSLHNMAFIPRAKPIIATEIPPTPDYKYIHIATYTNTH